jgi:hypothetical protein
MQQADGVTWQTNDFFGSEQQQIEAIVIDKDRRSTSFCKLMQEFSSAAGHACSSGPSGDL